MTWAQDQALDINKTKLDHLYSSTFTCHATNRPSQKILVSYSSFYSSQKLELNTKTMLWSPSLKSNVIPSRIHGKENNIWILAIDLNSYPTPDDRNLLNTQLQALKKIASFQDLVVPIHLNAVMKNPRLMPQVQSLGDFDVDAWLKKAISTTSSQETITEKDRHPLSWIYQNQNEIKLWTEALDPKEDKNIPYPCDVDIKEHRPRTKLLIFSHFQNAKPLETSTVVQENKALILKEFHEPKSPLYMLHLLVVSPIKDPSEELRKELTLFKGRTHLQQLLIQPTLDRFISELKASRDIYQHLFMTLPVEIPTQFWAFDALEDHLDIGLELNMGHQKIIGNMQVSLKDHENELKQIIQHQHMQEVSQAQTEPKELVISLNREHQWFVVGGIILGILLLFRKSIKKTPTSVFQPKLPSLDKTRPVSDLIGFDLYSDMISEPVDFDVDSDDLSPMKSIEREKNKSDSHHASIDDAHINIIPNWSKNISNIEGKSVISKLPKINTSPLSELKNPHPSNQSSQHLSIEDDWFQNSEQRHSQTFNIVNALAKPKPNTASQPLIPGTIQQKNAPAQPHSPSLVKAQSIHQNAQQSGSLAHSFKAKPERQMP